MYASVSDDHAAGVVEQQQRGGSRDRSERVELDAPAPRAAARVGRETNDHLHDRRDERARRCEPPVRDEGISRCELDGARLQRYAEQRAPYGLNAEPKQR